RLHSQPSSSPFRYDPLEPSPAQLPRHVLGVRSRFFRQCQTVHSTTTRQSVPRSSSPSLSRTSPSFNRAPTTMLTSPTPTAYKKATFTSSSTATTTRFGQARTEYRLLSTAALTRSSFNSSATSTYPSAPTSLALQL